MQFVAFVVRDGCKAKEILSNHGKMHKDLCGRIKDELQLNMMVMGPSGLHFGPWSYEWLTKSDDWQYWTKKWKYEIAHHLTNDWALFCCLARRKRLVQFEVFEKIYFEWLVQFMVFEKFGHRPNNSLNCLAELWTSLRFKDVRYHRILLFWSNAVVLTERTVWINYFCTWYFVPCTISYNVFKFLTVPLVT